MTFSNAYKIHDHRLLHHNEPTAFLATPNQSNDFTPKGIVLHDTAGRLDKGSSVRWMQNANAKASAHLVIERDGSLTQMVLFDRKAWHAGKSSYQGRENVNEFAIGIEIVNPGRCQKRSDGTFKPWFSETYQADNPELDFAFTQTREHGAGWWLHYSKEQLATLEEVCCCLIRHYDLTFLTGHYVISPGRKIDPNPLFPLSDFQQKLFGNAGNRAWAHSATPMRKWPSYKNNVILTVPEGAVLSVIRQGH